MPQAFQNSITLIHSMFVRDIYILNFNLLVLFVVDIETQGVHPQP